MISTEVRHRLINTGNVRLHVVEAGPLSGEPVVLLHGFPDFWIGWRAQIGALAAAGYRVVVPDQRGYNISSKPKGIRQYALPKLLDDLAGLADAMGLERLHLVGHDWGGIVAWSAGVVMPSCLASLTVLNAPHPEALFPYVLRSPSQILRSSYAAFFQFPIVPEALLRARQFALLVRAVERSSCPGAFTADDITAYRQAWEQPGAISAMLNWYRALRFRPQMTEPIDVPTLVLWGMRDRFLEPGLARSSLAFCRDGELQTFSNATHWLQRDEPAAVSAAIIAFISKHRIT
nr:alpha/beta fold hydrolase [Aureimonas sp. AU22]